MTTPHTQRLTLHRGLFDVCNEAKAQLEMEMGEETEARDGKDGGEWGEGDEELYRGVREHLQVLFFGN